MGQAGPFTITQDHFLQNKNNNDNGKPSCEHLKYDTVDLCSESEGKKSPKKIESNNQPSHIISLLRNTLPRNF